MRTKLNAQALHFRKVYNISTTTATTRRKIYSSPFAS